MQLRELRTVLLIQSIEETDRAGEVIPLADRADASREVLRGSSDKLVTQPSATLSSQSQSFLVKRSEHLLERLRLRSPAVMHVLALSGGLTWLGRFVLVAAVALGVSLSALDGSRHINILAFPLIGLMAWNLFVYGVLIVNWIRTRGRPAARQSWSAQFYERWIARRIESLMRHSTRYNVPLTTGLRRFAAQWGALSQPILWLRAKRLMHLAAALLAIGLIVGLYIRGIALRYEAGWESTFLGPQSVHALICLLYEPASALSGIALGPLGEVGELRWTATGGGGDAAKWIHLIALTAVLYIVLPRLLAAAVASFGLWRLSRRIALPPSLLGYARTLVIGVGGTAGETAAVVPYAYEPRPPSISGLESLLAATLGANLKVRLGNPVKYGDEETVPARLATSSATWHVILMTLAATPEVENHGAFLAAWRDWLLENATSTPLLIVIDEGPYATRMRGEVALEQRVQERRKLWREFVTGYGLRAVFADLIQIKPGAAAEINARDEARSALWTASERA